MITSLHPLSPPLCESRRHKGRSFNLRRRIFPWWYPTDGSFRVYIIWFKMDMIRVLFSDEGGSVVKMVPMLVSDPQHCVGCWIAPEDTLETTWRSFLKTYISTLPTCQRVVKGRLKFVSSNSVLFVQDPATQFQKEVHLELENTYLNT